MREGGGGAPGVRQPGPAADRRPMPRHFGTSGQRSGGQLLTHECTHTERNINKLTYIQMLISTQSQKESIKHLTLSHTHRTIRSLQLAPPIHKKNNSVGHEDEDVLFHARLNRKSDLKITSLLKYIPPLCL